jgi:hypothetical protein
MISAIILSNHGKNTLYLHTRDITKEDQEQSKSSFRNQVLLVLYSGSGLQRTQREYHFHDLPHGSEYTVHS